MKTLTVLFCLFISISISAATDEAAMLKAVQSFELDDDVNIEIDTDALVLCEAVDIDDRYTIAAYYCQMSYSSDYVTYMYLLKKSGSSYRVLEVFDYFRIYRPYFEPLDFLEKANELGDGFFAYGYSTNLAGGRSIEFDYYILCRINEDKVECLFQGNSKVSDSYYTISSDLRDSSRWRSDFTMDYEYEYRYLDIDDEMPLLLLIEYYKTRWDPERLNVVRFFHYNSDLTKSPEERYDYSGFFEEEVSSYTKIPDTLYSDILMDMNDDKAYFLLADRARHSEYDVPKAIELYEKAAEVTDDIKVKRAVTAKNDELSFYNEDPKEAVKLFDNSHHYGDDRYDELFDLYPESKVAGLALSQLDGFESNFEFVTKYPEHPLFTRTLTSLLWRLNYENKIIESPSKIEESISRLIDDDDANFEFKVGACVDYGVLVERLGDNQLAMEYFQKGYDLSESDIYRDGCTRLIALQHYELGEHKKAFMTAIEVDVFYGDDSYPQNLSHIIGTYEIVDGNQTLTISELAGDEEIHFEIEQFDGEGDNEILMWKAEQYPTRYLWAKILEFRGDQLHVVTTIPGGFYTLKIDTGLDLKPNVFTETVEMTSSEPGSYSTMYGFYDDEYRELGKFYLGIYPRLTTPHEQRIFELEIPVYDKGRIVNVGEYAGDPDTWQYFDESDSYIFNEEEAYFIKRGE